MKRLSNILLLYVLLVLLLSVAAGCHSGGGRHLLPLELSEHAYNVRAHLVSIIGTPMYLASIVTSLITGAICRRW